MTKLTMIEFDRLPIEEKIFYGLKTKMNYYKFYRIRKDKRNFRHAYYDNKILESYCPLCKEVHKVVKVGMMNARTPFGMIIEYNRCENCLIKLPVTNKKILKLLGYDSKPKELPKEQTTLI